MLRKKLALIGFTFFSFCSHSGTVAGNDLKATFLWIDKGKYEKPEQVK